MEKTLVLLFHPDFSRSVANAAMRNSIVRLAGIEVIDMYSLYKKENSLASSSEYEARRLLLADRIILQFPLYWYSTPPLLKHWQDTVLTRMFYFAYEKEGRFMEGKPFMVAATAGNTCEAYQRDGRNLYTIEDLLAPVRATANRCGLRWSKPFIVYQADKLSQEQAAASGDEYKKYVANWLTIS